MLSKNKSENPDSDRVMDLILQISNCFVFEITFFY